MLDIQNITVSYDNKNIINDLSLRLEKGQVHGLVGLNGAGKTTLLNSFYQFKKADAGTFLWENRPLKRADIAYLEAENFFYSNITGLEYLELFTNDLADLPAWNGLLQLPLDELIEYYSTGMKKKLALLAILKLNRPILILDEPFNGLDIETTELVKKIIKILRGQGKTIILTSHIFEILISVCDTVYLLEKGQITHTVKQSEFEDFYAMLKNRIDNNQATLLDNIFEQKY
jgi:ABC-2 type transport system ATP-binding protein